MFMYETGWSKRGKLTSIGIHFIAAMTTVYIEWPLHLTQWLLEKVSRIF